MKRFQLDIGKFTNLNKNYPNSKKEIIPIIERKIFQLEKRKIFQLEKGKYSIQEMENSSNPSLSIERWHNKNNTKMNV